MHQALGGLLVALCLKHADGISAPSVVHVRLTYAAKTIASAVALSMTAATASVFSSYRMDTLGMLGTLLTLFGVVYYSSPTSTRGSSAAQRMYTRYGGLRARRVIALGVAGTSIVVVGLTGGAGSRLLDNARVQMDHHHCGDGPCRFVLAAAVDGQVRALPL